jgi:hypothetical protein
VKATELAWAAGFFDGEGNTACAVHESRKQATYFRAYAQIAQVDRRALDRFKRVVRAGTICGPYKNNNNGSPYFTWRANKFSDVQRIYSELKPYLCVIKIKQFSQAIAKMKAYRAGAHARHVAAGRFAASIRWGKVKNV